MGLLEAAKESGLKKVIFASSFFIIIGDQQAFPATEEHTTWPISTTPLISSCVRSIFMYYQVQYGISAMKPCATPNVYGPRQSPHGEAGVVAIFLNKMLAGEQPVINGKKTRC